tara:strand:+ start:5153 stop:6223 length:1071 start_codon:yes stop_codon:yes gene_type:complete
MRTLTDRVRWPYDINDAAIITGASPPTVRSAVRSNPQIEVGSSGRKQPYFYFDALALIALSEHVKPNRKRPGVVAPLDAMKALGVGYADVSVYARLAKVPRWTPKTLREYLRVNGAPRPEVAARYGKLPTVQQLRDRAAVSEQQAEQTSEDARVQVRVRAVEEQTAADDAKFTAALEDAAKSIYAAGDREKRLHQHVNMLRWKLARALDIEGLLRRTVCPGAEHNPDRETLTEWQHRPHMLVSTTGMRPGGKKLAIQYTPDTARGAHWAVDIGTSSADGVTVFSTHDEVFIENAEPWWEFLTRLTFKDLHAPELVANAAESPVQQRETEEAPARPVTRARSLKALDALRGLLGGKE